MRLDKIGYLPFSEANFSAFPARLGSIIYNIQTSTIWFAVYVIISDLKYAILSREYEILPPLIGFG